MFYLQTGIHFQKIETVILVNQEFYRPCADIVHCFRCRNSLCAHLHAQVAVNERRRRLFYYLLMPTLHGTFPVIEVNDVSELVAQNLELYMVRFFDEFLYIYRIVTESSNRLSPCRLIHFAHVFLPRNQSHAFAAAAHRRLQHYGKTYLPRHLQGFFRTLQRLLRTGNDRHSSLLHLLAGTDLVAHSLHSLRMRTDEYNPLSLATTCKLGILAKEAIPRVYGIHVVLLCRLYDMVNIEVAVTTCCPAYALCLVGKEHMARTTVCRAIHGNTPDTHLVAAAHHAQSNLATISD